MAPAKEEKKGNYAVLSGFCIEEGGKSALPGAVVELTESQARRWVGLEYVEPTDEKVREAPKDPNHRKAPQKPAGRQTVPA